MNKLDKKKWAALATITAIVLIAVAAIRSGTGKQQEAPKVPVIQQTTEAPTTAPEPLTEAGTEAAEVESVTQKQTVRETTKRPSTKASEETETSTEETCAGCQGTGWIICPTCSGRGLLTKICAFCEGTGVTDRCHTCDGTGMVYDPGTDCPYCDDGRVYVLPQGGSEGYYEQCSFCGGSGLERAEGEYACEECDGSGRLKEAVVCEECGGNGVTVYDDCPDCYVDENGVHTGMIPCPDCDGSKDHPQPPTLTANEAETLAEETETTVASGEDLTQSNDETEEESTSAGESEEVTSAQESSESAETADESETDDESKTDDIDSHIETNVAPGMTETENMTESE